jgi:tetratricopeptide (TPR) repeat protein
VSEIAMNAEQQIALAAQAKAAGQPAEARKLLSFAIAALRETGSPLALAKALRALGEAERQLPDSDGGLAAYEEAATLARNVEDPRFLAHTVRHLGDLRRHHEDFDRAAECYDEALALYRAHADLPPLDAANAHRAAAVLHEKTGRTEDAQTHWREAKRFYELAGITEGLRECEQRLAREQ